MRGSVQKQPRIKILPVLKINEKLRLREEDIEDVVKTVQGVMPQHVYGDMDMP